MENEIRKEALRIVPLDEREQQIGSLLAQLDRKPSFAVSAEVKLTHPPVEN